MAENIVECVLNSQDCKGNKGQEKCKVFKCMFKGKSMF